MNLECKKCNQSFTVKDEFEPPDHGLCWPCSSEEVSQLRAAKEKDILQMSANVRRNTLREAAKVICTFCCDPEWSDAQDLSKGSFEHYERCDANKRATCTATPIWKLIEEES